MVVDDAHERHDVGAFGQRIAMKVAAEGLCAVGQPQARKARARRVGHGRQVEHHRLQARRAFERGSREYALAAAQVEQLFVVAADRIRVEHLPGDERLRRRHQRRVRRRACIGQRAGRAVAGVATGVRPVLRQLAGAAAAAQQRQRVGQIGIERTVVLDHRLHRVIADHRRAERAQAITRALLFIDTARLRQS